MPDDPYRQVLRALRDRGLKVTESGANTASVQCPVHDDTNASATVSRGSQQPVLFNCNTPHGCTYDDAMAALGLDKADVSKPDDRVWTPFGNAVAVYQYRDETGQLLYEVCRTADKQFPVRVPDPAGKSGWRWKFGDTRRVLYQLPELLRAQPGAGLVFLVEGEKDVHAIEGTGNIATTAMNGAQGFAKTDPAALTGHYVTAVVDRPAKGGDASGEKWAAAVEKALRPIVKGLRFVQAKTGKDAHDHLSAGYGIDDFEPYMPPAAADEPVDYLKLADDVTVMLDDPARTNAERKQRASFAFISGGPFILDVPEVAPAVWGDGKDVIWAQGEALMLCGPSGVGKTTIAVQLLRARLGLQSKVLGYSVAETTSKVLYLVMDRPAQFRRAAARAFTEDERGLLVDRLVIWKGPPPKDMAAQPELLIEMCEAAGADTVFIDSIKDAAVGIAKDEVGAGYNRARQNALSEGVEVIELHHMRKGSSDNKSPNTLDDIYGSTWLTAGAGSVALLWGEAGDPVVKWRHLKQPEVEVGPFDVVHDHERGVSEVEQRVDLVDAVRRSGIRGLTVLEYAVLCFEAAKPTPAQKKRAQRALDRKVSEGVLSCIEGSPGGDAARYYLRQATAA